MICNKNFRLIFNRYADSDQSEDEGIQDYKIGGYHPIHMGEIMVDRYMIV
jgi:serine/threonine-protein kinase SRPK3